ncbi:MAG: MBL fold metallo-hydrolase, partial [Sphingobacteriales bacterium]
MIKKIIKKMLISLAILLAVLTIAVFIFMQQPQFGKLPSGERLERIKKSPNYRDGAFQNLHETPALTEGASYFGVLKEFLFNQNERKKPTANLPSVKTDLAKLPADSNFLIWFGHSSYYMQLDGKKFLVDPVFSGSASPLPGGTKAFMGTDIYKVEDFPAIDFLLITHDHWDHLDYKTIKALKSKTSKVVCALGVGEHLEYWGYDNKTIIEKDWYDSIDLAPGFKITLTPGRHFAGRTFKRNTSLWTSFVLKTPTQNIFLGGDSGYDT